MDQESRGSLRDQENLEDLALPVDPEALVVHFLLLHPADQHHLTFPVAPEDQLGQEDRDPLLNLVVQCGQLDRTDLCPAPPYLLWALEIPAHRFLLPLQVHQPHPVLL